MPVKLQNGSTLAKVWNEQFTAGVCQSWNQRTTQGALEPTLGRSSPKKPTPERKLRRAHTPEYVSQIWRNSSNMFYPRPESCGQRLVYWQHHLSIIPSSFSYTSALEVEKARNPWSWFKHERFNFSLIEHLKTWKGTAYVTGKSRSIFCEKSSL